MHYFVLASDYDGTLATDGMVHDETIAALERLRDSGRKLILVTGRELDDLLRVFPGADLFDCIVAENGALLYWPASGEEKLLGERPPLEFVNLLRSRNVTPLSVGKVIVATWHPNETIVIQAIRDLGLELQVIFNKGAVMILPSGINKAAGLKAALDELKLSPHNVVGVGDAENDHSFLNLCECSVAVANALPKVKERADFVTNGSRGAGVVELIDKLIESDLYELETKIKRHDAEQLDEDKSFYFRGPNYNLNLRAQNLIIFNQIAEGVDDDTWLFHLQQHDYSRWFREAIKDEELGEEAEQIERRAYLSPEESRDLIKEAIERRYTLPD